MKSANSTIPPGAGQSWDSSLRLLNAAEHSQIPPVVAGFDGFVDTILHAVSERRSSTEYSRLTTLQAYLGCMGLGGGWVADTKLTTDHERQAREFLDAAEEIGANFFDHANIYGRGRAEEVFGRVLKERPYLRDRIVLQSLHLTAAVGWRRSKPDASQWLSMDIAREQQFTGWWRILARHRRHLRSEVLVGEIDPEGGCVGLE
jgi:hypothetical protein